MKSSKKRSRAVVTVVACILAVCLVAALVLFSLVNSKVRALQKGAAFEFSYNITAQDSSSTPALYNILKQVGATSGDVAGLYSPGQLQLYLYPSGGLTRAETGGTDFFTDLYIDANDTYFDAGRLYRTLRDSIADSAPLVGAFLPEWSLPNYITQAQLAALLLGRRYHRQSVHYELCIGKQDMEQRLSHGWADTAWHCTASACYSAGMECEPEYIPGGRKKCRSNRCA